MSLRNLPLLARGRRNATGHLDHRVEVDASTAAKQFDGLWIELRSALPLTKDHEAANDTQGREVRSDGSRRVAWRGEAMRILREHIECALGVSLRGLNEVLPPGHVSPCLVAHPHSALRDE